MLRLPGKLPDLVLTDAQRRMIALGDREKGVEIFWDTAEIVISLYSNGLMRRSAVRTGRRLREFAFTTDKGRALVGIQR